MESSPFMSRPDGNGRRSRRSNLILVVVTVSIAAIMIVSGLILAGTAVNSNKSIAPKAGDYFHYDIAGKVNSTPVEGNLTIELHDYGYSSYHYGYTNEGIASMTSGVSSDQMGQWVGDHRITTVWGEKTSKMYVTTNAAMSIILTDVGIDSAVIYRTTFLTANSTIQSVLTDTNISEISAADTRINSEIATGLAKAYGAATKNHVSPGLGILWSGSVEISEGQNLSYEMTIPNGFVHVFTTQDLFATSNGLEPHYEPALSLEWNQTGTVNESVPAGTYWFFAMVTDGSNNGYFRPYWG